MKKTSLLSLLLVFSIFIFSCKKELEPQDSSAEPAAPAVAETQAATQLPNAKNMQQNLPVAAAPQPQQINTQPQAIKTAPGMNPPHGQPNHRCDIAVGAPLNSPPGKTVTPTQAIQAPLPQTPQASAPAILNPNTAAATAPGMNPPHGQEGHRCDVAVGAPLPKV